VSGVTTLNALTNFAAAQTAAQPDACAQGYVWREAFVGDHVCVSPDTREQTQSDNANAAQRKRDRDECIEGLVWRLANAEDHVCVPQMTKEQAARDNELAETRLTGSQQTPPRISTVPMPPAKVGCHVFREGEWRDVPCATEEERKRLGRPLVAIVSRSNIVGSLVGNIPFNPRLNFARLDIELLSDPAKGSVIDIRQANKCPSPNDQAANTPDMFSVQLNTNFFPATFGGGPQSGWVQFVLQTPAAIGSDQDALCVWKVDAATALATNNANGYDNTACVYFKRNRTFLGSNAGGRTSQVVSVFGLAQRNDAGTRVLTAVAGVPWNDPSAFGAVYAVSTTDTVNGKFRGLNPAVEYPLGLGAANWWQASGDIYGNGCNSVAQFSGTEFRETLTAATCNPFDPSCLQAPMTTYSLPYFAGPLLFLSPDVTAETNNLKPFFGFGRGGGKLGYGCPHSTECVFWDKFSSP
jgi:hypothetical protein